MPTKAELEEMLKTANAEVERLTKVVDESIKPVLPADSSGAVLEEGETYMYLAGELTLVPTDAKVELIDGNLYHYVEGEGMQEVAAYAADGKAATVDEEGGLHVVAISTTSHPSALTLCARIIAMVGADDWNVACAHVANESDNNVNVEMNEECGHCVLTGLTEDEMTDAVLHVLLRPVMDKTTEEFAEAIGNQSVRITTLQDENRRLRVERDDALHKLGMEKQAKQQLHGSIDSLKPVT